MKKHDNLIYIIKTEAQGFSDKAHLNNFIKYLFSMSREHRESEATKTNFYLSQDRSDETLSKYGFINDSQKKYSRFINKFSDVLNNPQNLKNDLFYIGFIIHIEQRIIGNVFKRTNKGSHTLEMDLPASVRDLIVQEHFANSDEDYFERMGDAIDDALEYVHFDDASEMERFTVEKMLHAEVSKKFEEKGVLLSISHNDQEQSLYHAHRLILNE